jgi:hypothetical protein
MRGEYEIKRKYIPSSKMEELRQAVDQLQQLLSEDSTIVGAIANEPGRPERVDSLFLRIQNSLDTLTTAAIDMREILRSVEQSGNLTLSNLHA